MVVMQPQVAVPQTVDKQAIAQNFTFSYYCLPTIALLSFSDNLTIWRGYRQRKIKVSPHFDKSFEEARSLVIDGRNHSDFLEER
jgi:hypothetical protein